MVQCTNHPDREAEAVCSVCGKPVCGECLAPAEGDPVCFDCSITLTEKELGREHEAEAAPPAPAPAARQSHLSTGIKALSAVGIVIILAELAVILFMGAPQPSSTGTSPAINAEKASTLNTVTDSIVVTQSLESYRATHGHYPQQLGEITDSLPAPLHDRISGAATAYTLDEKGRYHLEINEGGGAIPVVAGSGLKAPVLQGVEP